MLLQELVRYSERLKLPPKLYSGSPVRYIIDIDREGHYVGLVDTLDRSNQATRRGVVRPVPFVKGTVNVRPLLLAQNGEYVLGVARPESRPDRVAKCHEAFAELTERCSAATQEAAVVAIATFLHDPILPSLPLPADFDAGATMTFRVEELFPIDLPAVQAFWAIENDPSAKDAPIMQCVVCGNRRPVMRRLSESVKRVPGGQTSGTAIISANSDAFESYGLKESYIAPTCSDCGERFTKAINELLAGERSCIRIGGTAFVFWTRQPNDATDLFFSLLSQPTPDEVHGLLERLVKSGPVPDLDAERFFGCSLSGSGGRAVVRDWLDTTVGEVKERVGTWFQRQAIVSTSGAWPPWEGEPPEPYQTVTSMNQPVRPLGIYALAAATVRDAHKDMPPTVPRSLLRAALAGTPLPPSLLQAVVRRCQVDKQKVTRQRAALIKLALTFREPDYNPQEDRMPALDPRNPSVGYQCGRLLAVLEQAQRQAIRGINQTIVDRFYGTASSAPGSVFPRLVAGSKPHLSKLRRDRPGAFRALEARLTDILGELPVGNGHHAFPPVLRLDEQGMFALGYYHQRADDRARMLEAVARRKAGQATSDEADLLDETNPEAIEEE